jgi:DNA end-binding protein Ku
MRPIWTGAISFGLINIPVKIFSAVKSSTLDLDMLDSHDHSNIKFKRVNENTGKEVPYEEIVKGYKVNEEYVEDFEAAAAKKNKIIEILNFSSEKEIDSIYFDQPYYLEPEKGAQRAYALLRDALRAEGKVGVSSFVMRNRETLALLKPYQKVIVLNRIRFFEEIKEFGELKLPDISEKKSKEMDMAVQLIKHQTKKFDISKHNDSYTQKLLEIIHQKANGKKTRKLTKMKVVHTKKEDLMRLLKASLAEPKRKAS